MSMNPVEEYISNRKLVSLKQGNSSVYLPAPLRQFMVASP